MKMYKVTISFVIWLFWVSRFICKHSNYTSTVPKAITSNRKTPYSTCLEYFQRFTTYIYMIIRQLCHVSYGFSLLKSDFKNTTLHWIRCTEWIITFSNRLSVKNFSIYFHIYKYANSKSNAYGNLYSIKRDRK